MSAFISVRFLFKFFCHVLQKTADGQVLGTDLLAPSALDAVGRPAAGGGVDDVIIVVRVPVVVDLLRVHGGEADGIARGAAAAEPVEHGARRPGGSRGCRP